jgi:hypothetical protein
LEYYGSPLSPLKQLFDYSTTLHVIKIKNILNIISTISKQLCSATRIMMIVLVWFAYAYFAFYTIKWIDNRFLNKHFACNYPYYIYYLLTSVLTTLMIPFFLIFNRKDCVNSQ